MNKRAKEIGDINYINGMQLLYLKKGQPTRKLCWYFSKLKVHNEEWLSVKLAMSKLYFITALITIKNISRAYRIQIGIISSLQLKFLS